MAKVEGKTREAFSLGYILNWNYMTINPTELRKLPPPHELLKNSSWLETKEYWNLENDRKNIIANLNKLYPEMKWEELENHVQFVLDFHYGKIDAWMKNRNSSAHLNRPLPSWTKWESIRLHITKVLPFWCNTISNIEDCEVEIYIKDTDWNETLDKCTNFHEMLLENTVKREISISWKILFILSIGKKFSWIKKSIPRSYRVAQYRLSKSLMKYFGLNTDPIYKLKWEKKYETIFKLTANSALINNFQNDSIDTILNGGK